LKLIGWFVLAVIVCYLLFVSIVRPSHDRQWVTENAILPYADITGDTVTVYNVRNNTYRSVSDFDAHYYDRTYDVSEIRTVDFVVAPFRPPSAHTFLTFGFANGEYVSISIEARREQGETYDIWKGMARQFEMMYIIADESDVIKLRTNYRDEGDVYMYPIKITTAKVQALFLDMISAVNRIAEKPEFYHTITNNCTSAIVGHVNSIASKESQIGFSYKHVLPAYSGELVYELGLIKDQEGRTFEELQKQYDIKARARACGDAIDFSACIRVVQ
jgi:hypothetical protein